MDRFVAQITEKGLEIISENDTSRDYCEWPGLTCYGGKVTRVHYYLKYHGNFHVDSLPPHVQAINIQSCRQHYELQTRSLPRALQFCYLNFNLLYGSVDLRNLPNPIRRLDLSYNQLNGPIDLTELPHRMESLWLHANAIRQSVVFYADLPPDIQNIKLVEDSKRKNLIGEIRGLYPPSPANVRKIFNPFPWKKIRQE
ncbi:tyrosine-sulfated glycopeptide receptor 1-like protein [Perkinsela sp. CCAP 1560/4]|nr:tyrosine-sulfated glycopeptide receptor 1-like protein [Perkinsela sp. CCAP 1560/4]|eukprot:KNH05259.1 tyrosine-sulfated glycopeptide receptor 1-like protein [Perkinsela sp. CCAP 1560/4]